MKLWNQYFTPATVTEAVALLSQYAGQARVIAGGTDLLVDMRAAGDKPYQALIDITHIEDLSSINQAGNQIVIGAGVTHAQIVKSALLTAKATCLVESCGVVGGPQVRNVATLGGNVVHALPAGDGTVSLVTLDAEAEIIHQGERRWVPILDMYCGPGQSLLDSHQDLLLRLRFQRSHEREASAFKRIMRPQGVALPILGCAVWVRLDATLTAYEAVRLCISPAGPVPRRVGEVEAALAGQPANEEALQRAIDIAQQSLSLRTSKYRATAEYRREMVAVLLRRTLPLAVKRAQTGEAIPEDIGV
jgi:CO/xanthine dehydrogenase FAD-binding subunit